MNKEPDSRFKPFFIVGRGRSGTTLVRLLLDAHPAVAAPPEGQFIISLRNKYAKARWDKDKLLSFYSDLWLEERLDDWNLDKEKLKQDLLARGSKASFPDLCMMVYAHYALSSGKEGVTILGDKNPIYARFINELIGLFPNSKFIHVTRDYRDNILSYQRAKFDANNTSSLAYRWKKYNEEILKYGERYPDKFILVRHEDLLTNPIHHLERICSFLGVDFDPLMLEFYKPPRNAPKWWEWHTKFIRPLDKSRVYLWKKKMKRSDVLKADYICRNIANYLGYENTSKPRSIILFFVTLPGVLYGWIVSCLERFVFFLPTKLGMNMVTFYRVITGTSRRKRFKGLDR